MNLNIDNVSVKDYFDNLVKLTEEVRDRLKVHELKLKLAEIIINDWYKEVWDNFEGTETTMNIGFADNICEIIDEINELSRKYAKTDESGKDGYRD